MLKSPSRSCASSAFWSRRGPPKRVTPVQQLMLAPNPRDHYLLDIQPGGRPARRLKGNEAEALRSPIEQELVLLVRANNRGEGSLDHLPDGPFHARQGC